MSLPLLRALFARDLAAAARMVAAYPSDEALWTTIPGTANSGGVLARHLAGNIRHFIGHVLGGSGYQRDREDEFLRHAHPRAQVAAELGFAAAECEAGLDALTPEALRRDFPVQIAGVTLTTEGALMHLATHLTYHLGQMDYHRRMLDPAAAPIGALPLDPLRGL